jgi:hypothetical protein
MYDPEALAFINYAIYKKSQGKVKSEYSFEFSKEIDVNALYDLIGSEKKLSLLMNFLMVRLPSLALLFN